MFLPPPDGKVRTLSLPCRFVVGLARAATGEWAIKGTVLDFAIFANRKHPDVWRGINIIAGQWALTVGRCRK